MVDEEMHYLFKYFTERIHHLTRIMTRCQQEGTSNSKNSIDFSQPSSSSSQVNTIKLLNTDNCMIKWLHLFEILFPNI